MPMAYGYCRVSTQEQADKGGSIETQRQQTELWFKTMYEAKGFTWGGHFTDEAQSAAIPFLQRPGGFALNNRAAKGDVIIFPKLDRGFRCVVDCLGTVRRWKTAGIEVEILDVRVDTSSDIGMFMLTQLAAFAEFERNRLRTRIMEGFARRREKGLHMGPAPLGHKLRGARGRKVPVLCPAQRKLALNCFKWRALGWTFEDMMWYCIREKIPHPVNGRTNWTDKSLRRYYYFAAQTITPEELKQIEREVAEARINATISPPTEPTEPPAWLQKLRDKRDRPA